jgi:hypothetical protein
MEKRRCSPPELKGIRLKYSITDTAVHQHTAQKMKQGQLEKDLTSWVNVIFLCDWVLGFLLLLLLLF